MTRRAVAAVVVLVGVLIVIWSFQRRLIYLSDQRVPDVADARVDVEEVTLATDDGLSLAAWWIEAGPTAVIVFHGNAGDRGDRAMLGEGLADRGLSVLLVDYRGYGGNPGSPSQDGLVRDARAALEFVREQPSVEHVVYFGDRDGQIPATMSKKLAAAMGGDVETMIVPGAGHNDAQLSFGPEVLDRVAFFLESHVG